MKFKAKLPLKKEILDTLKDCNRWRSGDTIITWKNGRQKSMHSHYYMLEDYKTGMRGFITPQGQIDSVTFSLPRLLHGSNRHLITNMKQVNRAIKKAQDILSKVSDKIFIPKAVKQIHLVWHIPLPYKKMETAFLHAIHPRIRKTPEHHLGESLTFPGRLIRIKLYDKELECDNCAGDYTRVEIELSPEKVKEYFPELASDPMNNLDLNKCWKTYREISLEFKFDEACEQTYELSYSQDNLIAWAAFNKWTAPDGDSIVNWRCSENESRENNNKIRKRIGRIVPAIAGIDMEELFPVEIPDPIEVKRDLSMN